MHQQNTIFCHQVKQLHQQSLAFEVHFGHQTWQNGQPHAKSRIVVLGNLKDRYYTKLQCYAPILKYSSLHLLCAQAVGDGRVLQQDCKNEFWNTTLPEEELTVIWTLLGDSRYSKDNYWLLNKTLYGLCCLLHHWCNMFTRILPNIDLSALPHDPCLFSDVVASANPSLDAKQVPIHIGIYMDDFY